MKELRDVVCGFIQNFPLSIDNVVKSAATAQEFSHFENASQALFHSCAAFTKTQFTNADSILTFVQRHEDETTVMKLENERNENEESQIAQKITYLRETWLFKVAISIFCSMKPTLLLNFKFQIVSFSCIKRTDENTVCVLSI